MRVYRVGIGNHYLELGIEVPDFAFTGRHGPLMDKTIQDVFHPIMENFLRILSGWLVLILTEPNTDDRRIFRLTSCLEEANVVDSHASHSSL